MINCSLIGFGEWGRKIYDSIQFHKGIKIKYICRNNIQNISRSESKINLVNSYKEAINDQVDTVFIATPSETHFEIAKYALTNKKNVFVEKPICFYNNEFQILKNLAKNNSTILHVNYIHIYNENFSSMVEIYKKNKNNKEISVKILLGNNGPIRKNTSVLMDWGPHIFSMINYILDNHNYELIKSKNLFQLSSLLFVIATIIPLLPSGSFFIVFTAPMARACLFISLMHFMTTCL